ncbi:hypothetical protein ABBQ38_001878 [Trebouxia sp. C0009 RCD-2024]
MDAHIAQITNAGFTVLPLFAPHDLVQLRQHLQAWNSAQIAPSSFTTPVQTRIPELLTVPEPGDVTLIVTHPALLALMKAVLGPDIRLAALGANTLTPQDGTVPMGPWHIDYPYREPFLIGQRMPSPELPVGIQVVLAVDDFTLTNGATEVLPGSHCKVPPGMLGHDGSLPGAIQVQVPAGHALIMHGALWHRQRPNVSPHPRHAILATYTPEWVCPQDNMEGQLHAILHSHHLAPDVEQILRELLLGRHARGASMCGLQLRDVHSIT